MKVTIEKAMGVDLNSLAVRIKACIENFERLEIDADAVRFELDIEYADGGRVKLEGRLGRF